MATSAQKVYENEPPPPGPGELPPIPTTPNQPVPPGVVTTQPPGEKPDHSGTLPNTGSEMAGALLLAAVIVAALGVTVRRASQMRRED